MDKLTFEELMERYTELVNAEYDAPVFASYYVTDTDSDGTKEKPYKLKLLWLTPLNFFNKTTNGKYTLSLEQREKFQYLLVETFNKENIYLL